MATPSFCVYILSLLLYSYSIYDFPPYSCFMVKRESCIASTTPNSRNFHHKLFNLLHSAWTLTHLSNEIKYVYRRSLPFQLIKSHILVDVMYEIQINVKRKKFIASVGGSMKQVFNEVYSILNVAEIRKNNKNDFYSIHFDFKNIIHIELGISLFIYVIYMINLRYSKSWYYKEDYTKVLGIKLHITLLFKEEGK